jgi:hypothetical protein
LWDRGYLPEKTITPAQFLPSKKGGYPPLFHCRNHMNIGRGLIELIAKEEKGKSRVKNN